MPESDISGWPFYKDSESVEKPEDEYLAFVLNKLIDGDELSGDLDLSTKVVEGVTIEELLGGLEFAHLLTTRCHRCRRPMYITGWNNFRLHPKPICWECHRDHDWIMENEDDSIENPHLSDEYAQKFSPRSMYFDREYTFHCEDCGVTSQHGTQMSAEMRFEEHRLDGCNDVLISIK